MCHSSLDFAALVLKYKVFNKASPSLIFPIILCPVIVSTPPSFCKEKRLRVLKNHAEVEIKIFAVKMWGEGVIHIGGGISTVFIPNVLDLASIRLRT